MLPISMSRKRVPSLFNELGNFDSLFNSLVDWPTAARTSIGAFAIDVEDHPESYIVKANVPGIPKENIDLTLEGGDLTISVKNSGDTESKENGKNFVHRERWSGAASRTVSLPFTANSHTEDVEAKLKDGVLTLIVRKQAEKQAKKISIS